MKKFILRSVLFLAICLVLDVFVGLASSSLQKSSKGGLTQKDEYIKNKMNADIIIMGSSRASHHYVSNLIADSLRCSVYNAGMDGEGIIMNYGVLLEITKRYNPKTVIYELTPAFDWIKGDNERYLPHLRHAYNIVGIDSIFWIVNHHERIKMLSNSYRVNSLVPLLLYDNIKVQTDSLNGYIPLWGIYESTDVDVGKDSTENIIKEDNIDPLKAEYLQRLINLCNDKDINLIFAISPEYHHSRDRYKFGEELARNNNIRIIDYREMSILSNFNDAKLYQDSYHLNHKGAYNYTLGILNSLKREQRTEN